MEFIFCCDSTPVRVAMLLGNGDELCIIWHVYLDGIFPRRRNLWLIRRKLSQELIQLFLQAEYMVVKEEENGIKKFFFPLNYQKINSFFFLYPFQQ
jgi:hypothetical protein